jgi:hypothetical protein
MNCEQVQHWLCDAEDLGAAAALPAAITDHLAGCAECREWRDDLVRLEDRWRGLPVPAALLEAGKHFRPEPQRPPAPARRPRRPMWRLAVAASLLLAVGLGTWLLLTPPAQAADEVVDRLVDLNLELTEARTPEERQRIFAGQAAVLEKQVADARLSEQDRELAKQLLDNAAWMVGHVDPLDEADRFQPVADQLLERLQTAAVKGNGKAAHHWARLYERLSVRGVNANLERAEQSPALSAQKKHHLEKQVLRDEERLEKLETFMQQPPAAAAPREVRQALELAAKKPRGHRKKK